jgi:hypothetical protein
MSWIHRTTTLALAGCLIAFPIGATTSRTNTIHPTPQKGEPDLAPTGKGWGEHHAQGQAKPGGGGGGHHQKSNGIDYHGGPVMVSGVNVYYIWYGGWSGNSATTILTDLANNIGGSDYFNINTSYYDGSNTNVLNSVNYSGAKTDSYSHGTALSDGDIQAIVAGAYPNPDPKGIYFVLTSSDVNETTGFCTQYCGWHTHGSIGGVDTKYAFIGNPDRCPSACAWQTTSPNGNAGADGMASIIAHEMEEAATDPDLNAWYDRRGYENADKCAWTFGSTFIESNGSEANVTLGSRDYLIQQNWVNASGGYCAMSY